MVAGLPTVPGTTYLEMARAAFAHLSPGQAAEIREVTFSVPLVIEDGDVREVATLLKSAGWNMRAGRSALLRTMGQGRTKPTSTD
jgi:polyketide synthase PksJ